MVFVPMLKGPCEACTLFSALLPSVRVVGRRAETAVASLRTVPLA